MGVPQTIGKQKFSTMKTLKHILLIALLLCVNLTSCTPDDSVTENEKLHTEVVSTKGDKDVLEEDGDID